MTEPRIEPAEAPPIMPRMGHGIRWADITAQIEADRAGDEIGGHHPEAAS